VDVLNRGKILEKYVSKSPRQQRGLFLYPQATIPAGLYLPMYNTVQDQNFSMISRYIRTNVYISACEMGQFPSSKGILPAFQHVIYQLIS